jgi:putative transposase
MHWFLEKVRDVRRVDEAALQLGLGRSVVYDLLKRYRQRSQTSSLLLGKRGREPKVPVLKQVHEQLLSSCIQDFYLKPGRPRLAALVSEVRRRFAEQDLPAPNYRTICKRVETLDLRLAIQRDDRVANAKNDLIRAVRA